MMNDDKRLDEELAALTDAVLEGQIVTPKEDLQGLDEVVTQLHQTIAPNDPAASGFRKRLERRLVREWNRTYRRQPRWYQHRMVRFAAVAVSLAFVFAFVALALYGAGDQNGDTFPGTATGALNGEVLAALVVLAGVVVGVVVLWIVWNRRR